jgi:hypothetical protein
MDDQLAKQNIESWGYVVEFYKDLTANSHFNHISPLLRLVGEFAQRDQAKYFRAGVSLWHLLISTALQHGLKEQEPFVAVTLTEDFKQFRIEHWSKTGGKVLERIICDEKEVFSCIEPVLKRLWEETKGHNNAV